MRTSAPSRKRLASASMRPSAVCSRALMSITISGRTTSSFIRSMSVVPPARNWASPPPCVRPAAAIIAAAGESARSNKKGRMSDSLHGALGLSNSVHDVGISGAAAQVSAHEFANLGAIARMPLPNTADRRDDLPGRAVAALKGVMIDESLLHRVQCAVGRREALDGGDGATLD